MKNIVKTLSALVITSFVLMGGCHQKIVKVNFEYASSGDFSTMALSTTGNNTFGSSVITSELKQKVEENGASLNDLDELKLKSANVAFKNPQQTDNFNGVESIEIWISADGLAPIKLASKAGVADGLNSVSFDVNTGENLANYIKASTFTYEIKGNNSEPLPAMNLTLKATYDVKASKK